VRKITSTPGIRFRTIQLLAQSLYQLSYPALYMNRVGILTNEGMTRV